ncbi:MAG TPA: NAD(P)H-binding protein [Pseudonocardiaceae bacterium]|nr:NAD(P)H-binding protein [Pseudonocardiaceae bacterium]
MKLTIVAATGGIGQQVVTQAIVAGHDVTAVVRNPARVTANVRTVQVDMTAADPITLESAIGGSDAVLSCLGPRSRAEEGVVTPGTRAVIEAMVATGVRRIVVVSAAPIGTMPTPNRPHPPKHDPGEGVVMRYVLTPIVKKVLRGNYSDLALTEELLRDSHLDWTAIRPPRLTDGPLTGTYRTAVGRNLRRGPLVSRADVAHYMLRVLDQPETIRQAMGIAY